LRVLRAIAGLSRDEAEALLTDWSLWARPDQWPPEMAANGKPFATWLLLGGRGAGKTRTGAEWLRGLASGAAWAGTSLGPSPRLALVGETFAAVREVMIEGVSGLIGVHARRERPTWEAGRRRLVWPNGAIAQAFSAEEPDSLRGPQFHAAWCDELAKWPNLQATWDNLQFGLRLGSAPRVLVTTTPRPLPLLKALAAAPTTALVRVATRTNAYNLAPAFLDRVTELYGGTRLGRQELEAEFVEARPDAFWQPAELDARRRPTLTADEHRALRRIVVAVDPPAGAGASSCCGIVAAGIDTAGAVCVLADASCPASRPEDWAAAALALHRALEADALVAEANQGGEMVRSVMAAIDPAVPVTLVRATRGKHLRAEPVAALYAQGRVAHAGRFPALEDEMTGFGPDGLPDGRSPDRMDALVWAITALLEATRGAPRVRGV
jgi:phage terminase large subunit-like protein